MNPIDTLVAGELQIGVHHLEPAGLRLDWWGRSNDRQPSEFLAPFFASTLERAGASGFIEMHFENLDHLNSATISVLIRVIREARAKHIRLVIIYNDGQGWQRLSFDALRAFELPDGLLEFRSPSQDRSQSQDRSGTIGVSK